MLTTFTKAFIFKNIIDIYIKALEIYSETITFSLLFKSDVIINASLLMLVISTAFLNAKKDTLRYFGSILYTIANFCGGFYILNGVL